MVDTSFYGKSDEFISQTSILLKIIILSYRLNLVIQRDSFHAGFPTETRQIFLFIPTRKARWDKEKNFGFIILILTGEEHLSGVSSLCFLSSNVLLRPSEAKILFTAPCSHIHSNSFP